MYEKISTQDYLDDCLPQNSQWRSQVTNLVQQIEEQNLYKGKGGEIVRGAVCHLIHCLCMAGVKYNENELQRMFQTLIENLKHPNVEIQTEAANALESFCKNYFKDTANLTKNSPFVIEIMNIYKGSKSDVNSCVSRGLNMALGVLSDNLLKNENLGIGKMLIETLLQNCLQKGQESDDAETRKQAVKSLG